MVNEVGSEEWCTCIYLLTEPRVLEDDCVCLSLCCRDEFSSFSRSISFWCPLPGFFLWSSSSAEGWREGEGEGGVEWRGEWSGVEEQTTHSRTGGDGI